MSEAVTYQQFRRSLPLKNYLHNSMFRVNQRNPAGDSMANGAFLADRWKNFFGTFGAPHLAKRIPLHDGDRSQIGDESAEWALEIGWIIDLGGGGTPGGFSGISQVVENARTLAGKTVTISFWAQWRYSSMIGGTVDDQGSGQIGVRANQNFGTGGTPSATVTTDFGNITAGIPDNIGTPKPWTRYSMTATLPSTSGKIFGTNNDSLLNIIFILSSDGTMAGVPMQAGTFHLWGIQLEEGEYVTPLEKLDPAIEWRMCQRHYQQNVQVFMGQSTEYAGASQNRGVRPFTPMRAVPTMTLRANSSVNLTVNTLTANQNMMHVFATSPAVGGFLMNVQMDASAEQ